jgi:hypothetical protein
MKAFTLALSLLIASAAAVNENTVSILNNHAGDVIEEVLETPSLRHGRHLQTTTSTNTNTPERYAEYKKAHNDMRRKYHKKFGGEFVAINWNMQLKSEAEAFAKKLVKNCANRVPQAGENPNNYGVNSVLNPGVDFLNPASVMKLWENKLPLGYPKNGVFTQVLWSKTLYVGCADASSSPAQLTNGCTASVCFYAKAGNCAFGRFDGNVTQAVINGPACSTECPSNLKDGC